MRSPSSATENYYCAMISLMGKVRIWDASMCVRVLKRLCDLMDNLEHKLQEMLAGIDKLFSLAGEGLLKETRYGEEKERIETELKALSKDLDERDELRVEKIIPTWRRVPRSGVFLPAGDVNQASPLRDLLVELVDKYRGPHSAPAPKNETIIPAGRHYDGVRYLRSIFGQAQSTLFIKDNYLKPSVLDILSEYLLDDPALKVRLLVAHNRHTPAFRESYRAFRTQYSRSIEARIVGEGRDHPRYILVDEGKLFTPDHSLDRWGVATVNIYEHEAADEVAEVRERLEAEWNRAEML